LTLTNGDVWLSSKRAEIFNAITTPGSAAGILTTLLGVTADSLIVGDNTPNIASLIVPAEKIVAFDISSPLSILFTPTANMTLKGITPAPQQGSTHHIQQEPAKPVVSFLDANQDPVSARRI
jgi:hypothetical protein